jgi:hypothetical protein
MRNDDTVTLELVGVHVAATVEEAESFPSPHTGRELRRFQVSLSSMTKPPTPGSSRPWRHSRR